LRWLTRIWKPSVVVLQHSLYRDAAAPLASCTVISVNDDSNGDQVASVCLDGWKSRGWLRGWA
jgi:hypothetical protein